MQIRVANQNSQCVHNSKRTHHERNTNGCFFFKVPNVYSRESVHKMPTSESQRFGFRKQNKALLKKKKLQFIVDNSKTTDKVLVYK